MRATSKVIAGLATASVICAAPVGVALAKTTPPTTKKQPTRPAGTSYVDPTAPGGIALTLSRDGRQVRNALFAYKYKCSDGTSFDAIDAFTAIPIAADRSFKYSYDSGPQTSTTTPGGSFQYTEAFSGTVNKLGTKIIGTARFTLAATDPAGASYTCDTGDIRYKAAD